MKGGGLGGFAPGEWTDDTDQAVAIAMVAADGLDLRSAAALDRIAAGLLDWYAAGPADVGIQTRSVLMRAVKAPTGAAMVQAAREVHEQHGRSAGNGSLMRTGPVALALPRRSGRPRRSSDVGQLAHSLSGPRPGSVRSLVLDDSPRGPHRGFPTFRRHRGLGSQPCQVAVAP
jgi:ADP-ribosylglycohydrolase